MSGRAKNRWLLLGIALLFSCAAFYLAVIRVAAPDLVAPLNAPDSSAVTHGLSGIASSSAPKRWLVICLDGVPLSVMQSLWDRGHFHEFSRPGAVISSLPSDTETAMTEALHTKPAPGYEQGYFDRALNKMAGGPALTISGTGIPYIQRLDYDTSGWFKIETYAAPMWSYRQDLARFDRKFRRSSAPVFLAHLATTDAVLHIKTAEEAEPLLLEFETLIDRIYRNGDSGLGVIIFSDHGNTQTPSHPPALETLLATRGWQVGQSIHGSRDVVIPAYGLVGFAAVYCRPESIEPLAEDLRGVEGADLIFSHEPNQNAATIRAADSDAMAQLEWSADGQRYRYRASKGDPLRLASIFDDLRRKGRIDADGYAADEDLFAATESSLYPDAAARIRGWAVSHVRASSDILVSFKPGYDHGPGVLSRIVRLVSTHGGLEQSASLGFVMATYPVKPYTRLADLIPSKLLGSQDDSPQTQSAK
jgi:hypothetical protein